MNCRRADQLFSAAWEDELTIAERETLEAHIESCAVCRASYDGFARVMEAVQEMPRLEAASDFADGVWSRIRAVETAPRPSIRVLASGSWLVASFRPALAAAAGLAVVIGVVSYLGHTQTPSQSPRQVIALAPRGAPEPAASKPSSVPESRPARVARRDAPIREIAAPQLAEPSAADHQVALKASADQARGGLVATSGALAASPEDSAGALDSLFNHAYDVEFALDPVHLSRVPGQGRLTPARPTPSEEVGKRASVTF